MWRLSTNDDYFSAQILNLLQAIRTSGIKRLLTLIDFLEPIKLSNNKWSTSHTFCDLCLSKCLRNNVQIRKIFCHFGSFLASKHPINCKMTFHFILFQPPPPTIYTLCYHSQHHTNYYSFAALFCNSSIHK